jgi:hypothetical protein
MKQYDIVRISAETAISLVTVRKWSKGLRVAESTRKCLDRAAKVLGIDTEPESPRSTGLVVDPESE